MDIVPYILAAAGFYLIHRLGAPGPTDHEQYRAARADHPRQDRAWAAHYLICSSRREEALTFPVSPSRPSRPSATPCEASSEARVQKSVFPGPSPL